MLPKVTILSSKMQPSSEISLAEAALQSFSEKGLAMHVPNYFDINFPINLPYSNALLCFMASRANVCPK
jgi:hypothetical protein